jgi:hypothetical protein
MLRVAAAALTVLLSSCVACPSREHTASLTTAQVTRIAEQAARSAGYELRRYGPAEVHFEFARPDCTWVVFFSSLGESMPGHFSVRVHDRTKRTEIFGGL